MSQELPSVTTGALPASRKVYKAGTLYPDIRVPMREIDLHPTSGELPVPVYDPSGPYTDPSKGVEAATCEQAVRLDENGVGLGPTVCYGGRSLEQIESYIDRLTRLATLALERGAPVIHWG